MIKRYCDRCGQQIDEGVHAWYVLELHGTDGEFRHKELCEECYEYLCEKDEAPKADRKTEPNNSEIPNNCEHITEDGVTCAKYPACDDCLDNPLNKLKGSERLVKGSEQTDLVEDSSSLVKDLVKAFGEDGTWLERQGVYTLTLAEAKQRAVDIIESVLAKDEPTISKMEQVDKDINVRSKDEQTDCTEALTLLWIKNMVTDEEFYRIDARLKVMPQTKRSE